MELTLTEGVPLREGLEEALGHNVGEVETQVVAVVEGEGVVDTDAVTELDVLAVPEWHRDGELLLVREPEEQAEEVLERLPDPQAVRLPETVKDLVAVVHEVPETEGEALALCVELLETVGLLEYEGELLLLRDKETDWVAQPEAVREDDPEVLGLRELEPHFVSVGLAEGEPVPEPQVLMVEDTDIDGDRDAEGLLDCVGQKLEDVLLEGVSVTEGESVGEGVKEPLELLVELPEREVVGLVEAVLETDLQIVLVTLALGVDEGERDGESDALLHALDEVLMDGLSEAEVHLETEEDAVAHSVAEVHKEREMVGLMVCVLLLERDGLSVPEVHRDTVDDPVELSVAEGQLEPEDDPEVLSVAEVHEEREMVGLMVCVLLLDRDGLRVPEVHRDTVDDPVKLTVAVGQLDPEGDPKVLNVAEVHMEGEMVELVVGVLLLV